MTARIETPEQLAEIRARAEKATLAADDGPGIGWSVCREIARTVVPALCDALEAAWKERDVLRAQRDSVTRDWLDETPIRAERDDLSAKLAAAENERDEAKRLLLRRVEADRLSEANEEIARLREALAHALEKLGDDYPVLTARLDAALAPAAGSSKDGES